MVFRTFDKVSYGLIMDSLRPVHSGRHAAHAGITAGAIGIGNPYTTARFSPRRFVCAAP